jgi:hypothetical protein
MLLKTFRTAEMSFCRCHNLSANIQISSFFAFSLSDQMIRMFFLLEPARYKLPWPLKRDFFCNDLPITQNFSDEVNVVLCSKAYLSQVHGGDFFWRIA